MANPETTLMHRIMLAVGGLPDFRLWRNGCGVGLQPDTGDKFRYGLGPGSPDLIGVLAPGGRLVGLEVKTPRGRIDADQAVWHAAARRMGAFVAVVRSEDEALQALERARKGELE